ncbi:MAG: hypothetical protein ACR2NZ_06320 [Rubripirellula sp.]
MQRIDSLQCNHGRRGFSLIEPAVVALIAALAAIGVPQLMERSERAKATEAFKYLEAVHSAQERFLAEHQRFALDLDRLDLDRLSPAYFDVGLIRPSGNVRQLDQQGQGDTWSLVLTRSGGVCSRYGKYTVSFTNRGYDAVHSNIDPALRPRVDD